MIGARAKEAFLARVEDGARLEEAAAGAGFTIHGFYGVRRRDAEFRAAWERALAVSAAAERVVQTCFCAVPRPSTSLGANEECMHSRSEQRRVASRTGGHCVASNNGRRLQVRKMRHVRFTEERQAVFLGHFAGTCDTTAAAEAAGVDESTVYKHRLRNPDFAEAWQQALDQRYARLEAEAGWSGTSC